MKICTKCKNEYESSESYFYRTKSTKDGLTGWCKECLRAKQRKYKNDHREELNAKKKSYHHKTKAIRNKKARERYRRKKDEWKEYFRKYRTSEKGRKIINERSSKRGNEKNT